MDVNKIRVGAWYPYTSRCNEGRARVEKIEHKATGAWVTMFDKQRAATVVIRPSQLGARK